MLTVADLKVRFSRYEGLFGRRVTTVLDGVDLEVAAGEFVAVVGQSGAGKSLLAHAILGILPFNAKTEGRFVFDGEELCEQRRRALRGKRIALVPQAVTWLDPTATAERQVGWSARAAGRKVDERLIAAEFARYDLAATARRLFPHALSGGMARRVLTATATVSRADLLVADEPTTGLDPQVRDLALGLLRDLADEGKAVVVITHDLAAAMAVADRIVVLRSGRTIEAADAEVFRSGTPAHPYSRALRAALPTHGFALPTAGDIVVGAHGTCGHLGDCDIASPACATVPPPWVVQSSSRVRCHDARARDLTFTWSGSPAPVVDRVSLSIAEAEVVGLIGPSGTGKTTLARLLAGHLRPASGRILLDGRPLPERGPQPVQLVFQHAETAVDPRWKIGRILEEGWNPDPEVRAAFGIAEDWLGRRPHELSGGELQRIAIVRALVPGLRLLIADEPTAMHDAISQVRIWTALLAFARTRGFAILAVSHDDALLAAIGARVVSLAKGGLAAPASPS